jgi:hypothetical protein
MRLIEQQMEARGVRIDFQNTGKMMLLIIRTYEIVVLGFPTSYVGSVPESRGGRQYHRPIFNLYAIQMFGRATSARSSREKDDFPFSQLGMEIMYNRSTVAAGSFGEFRNILQADI